MAEKNKYSIGKRVGGALYVHKSAIRELDEKDSLSLREALEIHSDENWNVAKIEKSSVSLLLYEDFEIYAFPSLLLSSKIDLITKEVKFISYGDRKNPPILHRKELLLASDHPKLPEFIAITRMAEQENLFREPTKIGNKLSWLRLVDEAGLEIRGNRLFKKELPSINIVRHRTAIVRRDLSQPMQLLLSNGVISKSTTIFDYGCGQGDDVAALKDNGFTAFGWDPHHATDGERRPADIVNLGFVINVIEDYHEREETLKSAWSFTKRAMSVSAMISSKTNLSNLRPYGDGYLTSIGTFQKYYNQQELRDFIYSVINEPPVAMGSGIFAVFKDKDLEQEVLYHRRSRSILPYLNIRPPQRARSDSVSVRADISFRIEAELDAIWQESLEKGRLIEPIEIPSHIIDNLRAKRVSPARAIALCSSTRVDVDQLNNASLIRRDDLLAHFALGLFPGAAKYAHMPKSIQRDVKAFFGNHTSALELARQTLFSAGNPEDLSEGINAAISVGLGAMKNEATYRVQANLLNKLPAVIRVIIGCAGMLRGGTDGIDYFDIKTDAKSVSFITCFDSSLRLPIVSEKVRVDLRRLNSRIENSKGQVVYMKSRYMPADDPDKPEQIKIDNKLLVAGIVDKYGNGPAYEDLLKLLNPNKVNHN